MSQVSNNTIVDPGELAIGTAPLGGLYAAVDDREAAATLAAAAEVGVTHFDTAPHYGRGLAERRLGAFLASTGEPERFTVSTKVGRAIADTRHRAADDIFTGAPPGVSTFDFSPRAIRAQLEASRSRLGRDRIDIVFLHDPDDHLDDAARAAEELARLAQSGRVGAVGVGTNDAGVVDWLLDRVDLDVVLLAGRITLLETSGEPVAARCGARGVRFFAAGVFQSGILADAGDDTYDYRPAPADIRRRVADLRRVCDRHEVPLRRVAVAHARRTPGVTTTLVGVRSPAEARTAAADLDNPVSSQVWEAVDAVRACWTTVTSPGAAL